MIPRSLKRYATNGASSPRRASFNGVDKARIQLSMTAADEPVVDIRLPGSALLDDGSSVCSSEAPSPMNLSCLPSRRTSQCEAMQQRPTTLISSNSPLALSNPNISGNVAHYSTRAAFTPSPSSSAEVLHPSSVSVSAVSAFVASSRQRRPSKSVHDRRDDEFCKFTPKELAAVRERVEEEALLMNVSADLNNALRAGAKVPQEIMFNGAVQHASGYIPSSAQRVCMEQVKDVDAFKPILLLDMDSASAISSISSEVPSPVSLTLSPSRCPSRDDAVQRCRETLLSSPTSLIQTVGESGTDRDIVAPYSTHTLQAGGFPTALFPSSSPVPSSTTANVDPTRQPPPPIKNKSKSVNDGSDDIYERTPGERASVRARVREEEQLMRAGISADTSDALRSGAKVPQEVAVSGEGTVQHPSGYVPSSAQPAYMSQVKDLYKPIVRLGSSSSKTEAH